jgi:formate dehydrogenase subunit delta
MKSSLDKLVYMANQIAKNFAATSHDSAAAATADHIAQFWDPRMKSMIFAHLEGGGAGLDPLAHDAITILHDVGPPPSQTRATEFNSADESGHADAG